MALPTVTLEDLQAFQAKHFPGHHVHTPTFESQPVENQYENEYEEVDEDDLGYYPDGVKRTLTDEQIRIFRHSEIHALLRERQLRQEEEEEAALEDQREQAQTTNKNQDGDSAEQKQGAKANQNQHTESTEPSSSSSSKRLNASVGAGEALDYGDSSHEQKPAKRPNLNAQFTGRKIISYED